jgi:hypothetical protein
MNLNSEVVENDVRYKSIVLPGRVLSTVCAKERKHRIEGAKKCHDADRRRVEPCEPLSVLGYYCTIIGLCCVVCLNTTLTSHLHQRPIMLIGGTRAKFPNHVVQDDEPDNKIWGQVKLRQCCLSHLPIRASFMIDRSRPRGGRG